MEKKKIQSLEDVRGVVIGDGSFANEPGIIVNCDSNFPLFFYNNKNGFKKSKTFLDYMSAANYVRDIVEKHVEPYRDKNYFIDGNLNYPKNNSGKYVLNFKQFLSCERSKLLDVTISFNVR